LRERETFLRKGGKELRVQDREREFKQRKGVEGIESDARTFRDTKRVKKEGGGYEPFPRHNLDRRGRTPLRKTRRLARLRPTDDVVHSQGRGRGLQKKKNGNSPSFHEGGRELSGKTKTVFFLEISNNSHRSASDRGKHVEGTSTYGGGEKGEREKKKSLIFA